MTLLLHGSASVSRLPHMSAPYRFETGRLVGALLRARVGRLVRSDSDRVSDHSAVWAGQQCYRLEWIVPGERTSCHLVILDVPNYLLTVAS